jgi:hypothetical protein
LALDPISAALDIGGKIIDRIWPDPTQAAAAKLELLKMQQTGELAVITGQLEINRVEAASTSVFVAGWRPFVGWVCGAAFAYKFVAAPAMAFALTALGVLDGAGHPIVLPVLDFTEMSTVLLGMLGIGGFRTVEKLKGVA